MSARRTPVTRRDHLRRAAAVLLGLALASAVAGWMIHRAGQPEVRKPGEALPEITEKLSKTLPGEAPPARFADVTADAGLGDFVLFSGPRTSQLPEDMGAGMAWGDFDDDGDDDLFLVAAGGSLGRPQSWAPSVLYENLAAQGEPRFIRAEFPAPPAPETRIVGMAAAWGDADGDGRLDLVVTGYRSLLLFRNEAGGLRLDPSFPKGVEASDGYWSGASWADFDRDGDLDLYVCGYVKYVEGDLPPADERSVSQQYGAAVPYTLNPASFEPERNLLFENAGDGTFSEVALPYGVSNPEGRSLSALWHDFDADGRLDLYVANDISDNALYLNRGETFEDAGLEAWVADYRGAMGLAAGDWNRDGDDDLFVTHWIAQENALYDSRLADLTALRTDTDESRVRLAFSDVAAQVGLGQNALHMVGWGTEFADFDSDGWLDLVVANGSTLEKGAGGLEPQPAMLLWNQQGREFHDLAPGVPSFAERRVHRGLAVSDYDLDGDLDVVVSHLDGGVRLLRNDTPQGDWLQLRLVSRAGPVVGSLAVVRLGDTVLRRAVTGASYLSQSSRVLHFGLGDSAGVGRVEIHWPSGEVPESVQVFEGLEANARWLLQEGNPVPERVFPAQSTGVATSAGAPESHLQDDRSPEQIREFWNVQRAAMDAMKRRRDVESAIELFRRALVLNPDHGDSRYYLANCLWTVGAGDEALAELDRLRTSDPMSHRAHKQWGLLRALSAETQAELEAARAALERAVEINSEETGALVLLGEIDLLEGHVAQAEQRFEWVTRTHPKAVGAFFLRAYLAWTEGDTEAATALLEAARAARGEEWKPEGAAAEGDVARRMHQEETLFSRYWRQWDGTPDPHRAFAELAARLQVLDASMRPGPRF